MRFMVKESLCDKNIFRKYEIVIIFRIFFEKGIDKLQKESYNRSVK